MKNKYNLVVGQLLNSIYIFFLFRLLLFNNKATELFACKSGSRLAKLFDMCIVYLSTVCFSWIKMSRSTLLKQKVIRLEQNESAEEE